MPTQMHMSCQFDVSREKKRLRRPSFYPIVEISPVFDDNRRNCGSRRRRQEATVQNLTPGD